METIQDNQTLEVFENVFAFYGTLSPEGYLLSLTGKIFDQSSAEPEILIGQKFSETVFWQSSEFTAVLLENAVAEAANGRNSKTQLDFRLNSKEKIIIELYLQRIESGKKIFFCAKDITDKEKEIEFYKQKSEQLLYAAENSGIGLWFWDAVEDSVYSTPKCNELFDLPPHEVLTLDALFNALTPEDRPRVETVIRESQTTGSEYKTEFRVKNADGNINWISARGKTFLNDDGQPASMMGMVGRITDRKLSEEELRKVYALEKKARDEAVEANRAKDFFLAFVSHELRSPLNAILGWTKILLTKQVDEETRRNALETIEHSARSQAKLINDLVDSARVASGKLKLEFRPVNLNEILKNVFNSQKPQAENKNIRLDFSAEAENITIFGDSVRLHQIFTNLLSNSLKFTPAGGSISINLRAVGDNVEVSITDNGQGINPEFLPKIFTQFSQGDEKNSRDQTGLGLGLSIVKTLVEKHKGSVRAESEGIGKGSTFTVTLPQSEARNKPIEQKKTVEPPEKPLNGLKIMIVEDDPDSCEVLQLFLEQCGGQIQGCAMSAKEALIILHKLKNNLPDIIVSDLGMSEEDGYTLMSRIRNLPTDEGGKIPAIALSAFTSTENKRKAFEVGFQKYHTKPFEPDLLVKEILAIAKNN
jgi:PAS domain S-box-containing protein